MVRRFEVGDFIWYWTCHRFKDAATASKHFEKLNAEAAKEEGKWDLGCYRHGPENEGPRYVTCVSLREEGVRMADQKLGGSYHTLDNATLKALTMRRARVVLALAEEGASPGTHRITHQFGTRMNPDGTPVVES